MTSTPVEIVPRNHLSKGLEMALQDIGKELSDQDITDAFTALEEVRKHFQVRCIRLGTLLLMKKAALGHGKFMPWLEKMQIGSPFHFTAVSSRSCRTYMALAKRFLHLVDTGGFNEQRDGERRLEAPDFTARDLVDLPSLPAPRREELTNSLEAFIAGRSLDRMLKDFRTAEKDAVREISEEDGGAGGGGSESGGEPDQLELPLWVESVEAANKLIQLADHPDDILQWPPEKVEEFYGALRATERKWYEIAKSSKAKKPA